MIIAMTLLIAALGMMLLSFLLYQVRQTAQTHSAKKHQKKHEGFSDLLNYAALVDDGVIVGKNGSFMASWLYAGADSSSQTEQSLEMVSFRINQALSSMGSGWMIHVDAIRREAPGYSDREQSHFTDFVSVDIDEERRTLFESLGTLYEGYFVITLTWLPPVIAEKRFVALMFDDGQKALSKKATTEQLIEDFKRSCLNFESKMSAAVDLSRLNSELMIDESGTKVTQDNLLRYAQFCATGLNHPINIVPPLVQTINLPICSPFN